MIKLPPYLSDISLVMADPEVADSPMARRVRERLPDAGFTVLDQGMDFHEVARDQKALYLKNYKGQFLRFCPGTRAYHCCGYRIIHIGENCPITCTYCILQAYFQDRIMKAWANTEDLFKELENTLGANRSIRYRAGTGEFTDSLVLEPLTGLTWDLVSFLNKFVNIRLELKSKAIDLSWMDAARDPALILPAWSLNAPLISQTQEHGASTLKERLEAAKTCVEAGYRICLHFDPIIHYPGWQEGYGEIIDMIFDHVRAKDIAYMSLGSFRHMPELARTIEARHPQATYIHNEFITGIDNKMRLLRPLRVEQFRFMVDRLRSHGMDRQLYFCMESTEVWKAVIGYTPKDLGGLANHLMNRAFGDD